MENNDVEILIYKILTYLYECLKQGKQTEIECYSWESKIMNIPYKYWAWIMTVLIEKELIEGLEVTKDNSIRVCEPCKITFEGVEFLHENNGMKEAKEFLKDTFDVILSSVIGTII